MIFRVQNFGIFHLIYVTCSEEIDLRWDFIMYISFQPALLNLSGYTVCLAGTIQAMMVSQDLVVQKAKREERTDKRKPALPKTNLIWLEFEALKRKF
jgi:hypothetical protein